MKYCDIKDLDDLMKYCSKRNIGGGISINTTSPFHNTPSSNHLLSLYSSQTKALGIRLFGESIWWNKVSLIQGIIYSYDTPIGLIVNESLLFVYSKDLPFNNVTIHKLVTILNRNFMNIRYDLFIIILKSLGIDLGWLE